MKTQLPEITLPIAAKWTAAAIASTWASVPVAIQVLVVLMAIDYATGLASAYVRRELSSVIGFRGLVKKSLALVLIGLCYWMERSLHVDSGLEKVVAIGYAANEIVSIVENVAKAGVPVPAQLVEALLKAKGFRRATPEQLDQLDRNG